MKQEWKEAAGTCYPLRKFLPSDCESEAFYNAAQMKKQECFLAGIEWHDRSLNWIRDLVRAGIEKPEEAVDILKRIDVLLNENN